MNHSQFLPHQKGLLHNESVQDSRAWPGPLRRQPWQPYLRMGQLDQHVGHVGQIAQHLGHDDVRFLRQRAVSRVEVSLDRRPTSRRLRSRRWLRHSCCCWESRCGDCCYCCCFWRIFVVVAVVVVRFLAVLVCVLFDDFGTRL